MANQFLRAVAFALLFALVVAVEVELGPKTTRLNKYKVSDITVSGLSSGAYMAVQMHISFSSIINGSAIFAGGPFYCAESNLEVAEYKCMATSLGGPDVDALISLTHTDYTMGLVDNPDNLKNDKVYLFSGKDDTIVDPAVVHALQSYYSAFVSTNNIVADYNIEAEHCLPTLNYGEACATLASPYLGKCEFDGAGQAFKNLYGQGLRTGTAVANNLLSFDQTPYFSSKFASIGDIGYIYVPTACAAAASSSSSSSSTTACRLHVSFHGCEQNLAQIGNEYAAHAGFNSWAEANNIIVLYPYVVSSQLTPYNPKGCWDWWAYTNVNYGNKLGVQMQFVRNLISAVSA